MAVTTKWRQHIERWQSSGLSQAAYCAQQGINVRTFAARLSDYRKRPATDSVALVPVRIAPADPACVATSAAAMVFTDVHGHRLELSSSVSAGWVAELLRCLA